MTRINRPDTLYTELREIQRRLRLLEGAAGRGTTLSTTAAKALAPVSSLSRDAPSAGASLSALAAPAPISPAFPLLPTRPSDWPATRSVDWEGLLRTLIPPRTSTRLLVEAVSDPGTEGQVRVLVDGVPIGDDIPVTPKLARHAFDLPALDAVDLVEIVVQARRLRGTDLVRVAALLVSLG